MTWDNIQDKPNFATVATSGDYSDLTGTPDISTKADKVTSATNGHLAGLDSTGNLTDSGKNASDFPAKITTRDINVLSSDEVETLKVGDVVAEENSSMHLGESRYLYTVVLKENNANGYRCCLVRFFESKMYVVYYVWSTSRWIYDTTVEYDLANYVQKSLTAGLLKNDGTVDTTQYGTYSKPSGGIPASDLASGVIPTVPVQDVTVGGASVVNNGTAVIPAIPDVSGKADKVLVATTEPSGGMLPNVLYEFGELSGNTTFALATPSDNTIANHYYFTFDTPSTAPTITWPTGLTWFGGSAPTISASKHYEISVLNGIAVAMEV